MAVISAGLLVLGVCLEITACILGDDSNWYPLITVLVFALPLICIVLLGSCAKDSNGDPNREVMKWIEFLSGFMYLSVFGYSVMLVHTDTIKILNFVLALAGAGIFLAGFACGIVALVPGQSETNFGMS